MENSVTSGDFLQNKKMNWQKISDILVLVIAVGMSAFHLYAASFGALAPYVQTSVHWGFVGVYIILTRPLKFKGGLVIDLFLIVSNVFLSYYLFVLQAKAITSAGIYTKAEMYISILAVVVVLTVSIRSLGSILPIICGIFILYGLYGHLLPGTIGTSRFTVRRLATDLYANVSSGMYGQTLYVSAQFIFLFVLFGSLLELTGAGEFFVDLAFALTGRVRGGPAQAAVFSSALMGSINGSGAANVVTTGTFTIPLMKKVGYKPSMAGAVEAVASNGGQIMPPVMGAVAFLMSDVTGIPYGTIALAALIPSLLYYLTLSVCVYFTARRDNIPCASEDQIKKFSSVLKNGWLYFAPLIVLTALLIQNYSVKRSAFFSILVTMLVGFIKNRQNMTLFNILDALKKSVSGIASIAAACICAGIIMDVINLTGLGLKISSMIAVLSGGKLLLALVLSMITSLILGMGLPTSAAYMILAVLVAPAIVGMGASLLSAHLFILYFGALSTITPPVALSTFAAAGIAKAGIWETGRDAMKLAAAGFIIPFIFVYNEELLLIGSATTILWAFVTASIGCAVLSVSITGWGGTKISALSRILLFPCSILLFQTKPIWLNILGVAASAAIILFEMQREKRKKNLA